MTDKTFQISRRAMATVFAAAIATPAKTAAPAGGQDVPVEIAKRTAFFTEAFNAGDGPGAVDAYFVRDEDQPAVYPPGAPPIIGRKPLTTLFASLIERQSAVRVLRHDLLVSEGLAFETGRVIFTDNQGVDAAGRFAVGWVKTDYGWRAKIDFYSPDGWSDS